MAAMRPVIVVVALEVAQHGCSVSSVDDQETVEQFAADGADESFGDRVRPWRAHRRLDDLDVDGGEHGVEGGGELGVAVADQEPKVATGVVEIHEQVAGQMYQPGAGRVRGDPQDVYPAGGVLDDEERVQPVQGRWCRCGTCRRPRSPVPALGRTATRSDRSAVVRGRSR